MIPEIAEHQRVLETARALGHGSLDGVHDVVWVDPAEFNPEATHEMARALARRNTELEAAGRKYLLLVPGRLGSTNARLGVPVAYPHVSGAALLAELASAEFATEPSQGTHFFHNVLSGGVFYLFVDLRTAEDALDLDGLRGLPRASVEEGVIHSVSEVPLSVRVDASVPRALVYRSE